MKGYECHMAVLPSNQARGGSAILIKDAIDHDIETKIETDAMQLISVKIKSVKQDFNVGALYCPPNYNINKDILKDLLNRPGPRFLIGGDYNAKHIDWGSRLTSTRGKELRQAIKELGCQYLSTDKPTYWPTDTNKIPDLIDFFITKRIASSFLQVEDNYDLDSDHSAIILNMNEKIIKRLNKATLTNKFTDWVGFK